MNNQPFDFEKERPPVLNEKMLRKENERRKLIKQILILRIASVITAISIALFAFFIIRDSLIISILCIVFLFIYLSGSTAISVIFYKRGFNISE